MARIKDLVPAYFLALVDETKAAARTAYIRARIDDLARSEYAEHGSDRWKADDLGKSHVRLDGTQDGPKVMTVKPGELASYLAQHAPEHAVTTITVPAGALAAALEALDFAGVQVNGADAQPGPDAAAWVDMHCRTVPDPDTGGWVVQHVADDGTVITPDVPGLTAVRKPPRLVVSLDRGIKGDVEAEAIRDAETELAGLLEDQADEVSEPTPAGAL